MDYIMLVYLIAGIYIIVERIYTQYSKIRKDTKDDLIERYIEARRRKLI